MKEDGPYGSAERRPTEVAKTFPHIWGSTLRNSALERRATRPTPLHRRAWTARAADHGATVSGDGPEAHHRRGRARLDRRAGRRRLLPRPRAHARTPQAKPRRPPAGP